MIPLDFLSRRRNRNTSRRPIAVRPHPTARALICLTIQPPTRRQMCNAGLRCRMVNLAIITQEEVMVSPKLRRLHLDPEISHTTRRLLRSGIISTKLSTSLPMAHTNQTLFRRTPARHHILLLPRTLQRTIPTQLHNHTLTMRDTRSLIHTIMPRLIPQCQSSQGIPHTAGLKGTLHPLGVA